MKKITFLFFIAFLAMSCANKEEALRNTGIFEEHKIVRIDCSYGASGKLSGSFFGINGEMHNETRIEFWWLSEKNNIIFSSLPKDRFIIIVDEAKQFPTVQFKFYTNWLESLWLKPPFPSLEHHEDGPVIDFNGYINSSELEMVLIRISASDLSKESFLPKL